MNSSTIDELHAERPTVRSVPGPIVESDSRAAHNPAITTFGLAKESLPLPSRAHRTRRVPRGEDDGIGPLHPSPHLRPCEPGGPSDPITTIGLATATPTDRGAA
jgi:hypothetical protein